MDLADLIVPSSVIFGARANNKEQLLLALAARAAACLNLDPKMVFNALHAREQLGSTGLGEGFALPHARVEGLDRFFGMFARRSWLVRSRPFWRRLSSPDSWQEFQRTLSLKSIFKGWVRARAGKAVNTVVGGR